MKVLKDLKTKRKMEMELGETVEYHGLFVILPSGAPEKEERELLEAVATEFRFWNIYGYDLEPCSEAKRVSGEEVFEELARIGDLLGEMGWQLDGRVLRWGENPEELEIYVVSTEDPVVYRKRGFFETVNSFK